MELTKLDNWCAFLSKTGTTTCLQSQTSTISGLVAGVAACQRSPDHSCCLSLDRSIGAPPLAHMHNSPSEHADLSRPQVRRRDPASPRHRGHVRPLGLRRLRQGCVPHAGHLSVHKLLRISIEMTAFLVLFSIRKAAISIEIPIFSSVFYSKSGHFNRNSHF